jgi:hypothetical protein
MHHVVVLVQWHVDAQGIPLLNLKDGVYHFVSVFLNLCISPEGGPNFEVFDLDIGEARRPTHRLTDSDLVSTLRELHL